MLARTKFILPLSCAAIALVMQAGLAQEKRRVCEQGGKKRLGREAASRGGW
jgi:hypothetical protein